MGVAIQLMEDPEMTHLDAEMQEKIIQIYHRGVLNTLVSVGLAFGLEPVEQGVQKPSEVTPGLAGLLWAEAPQDR